MKLKKEAEFWYKKSEKFRIKCNQIMDAGNSDDCTMSKSEIIDKSQKLCSKMAACNRALHRVQQIGHVRDILDDDTYEDSVKLAKIREAVVND